MSFYESIGSWYDDIFPASSVQAKFVETKLEGVEGKSVLDVGCATGSLSIQLGLRGADVIGLDLDEEMLALAHKKAEKEGCANTHFLQADMLKLTNHFTPASFDGIVCFGNTLVHLLKVGDIQRFFQQCRNILKPNGVILLQIINYDYVLDDDLAGLPTIDNTKISFERNYQLREQDELINFKTLLTIKESGKTIKNSVMLLPLRRELLNQILEDTGFRTIHQFGSFEQAVFTPSSLPYIAEIRPYASTLI